MPMQLKPMPTEKQPHKYLKILFFAVHGALRAMAAS
jgi:hypothetical protein